LRVQTLAYVLHQCFEASAYETLSLHLSVR
jgi:hypothetical protein